MIRQILLLAGIVAPGLLSCVAQTPAVLPIPTPAQPGAIALLPAAKASALPEQWDTFGGQRVVRNVVDPTLTPVLPDPAHATGAAVIVAPGGAFLMLSMDNEGYSVAHWLAGHGIAAFVLKYRVNPSDRDPQAYVTSFMKLLSGVAGKSDVPGSPAMALADAESAMRLVRSRAAEWKIDPARVGFLGFSAGAMLTLSIGLDDDPALRPNFIAPIYAPPSPKPVPLDAPPLFAALAADDPLFGTTGLELLTQWRNAHRPVEFHFYEKGGHGFGMTHQGTTSDLWMDEFYTWVKDRGLLK